MGEHLQTIGPPQTSGARRCLGAGTDRVKGSLTGDEAPTWRSGDDLPLVPLRRLQGRQAGRAGDEA